ncbi:hypothetical protein [Bacillus mobilis]|uniref:hypothetical protein n=1 Tax=Bacillus mobilis TaxID=2026190 RepID=UPI003CE91797
MPDNFKRKIEEERHKVEKEMHDAQIKKANAETEKLSGKGKNEPIEIKITRKSEQS